MSSQLQTPNWRNWRKSIWIIQKVWKPRLSYFMIHLSSGAKIFRVSSPQVSLSVSKKSFWSHMYFLSIGSFKMVKNRKKTRQAGSIRPHFWMNRTFSRHEILQGDQKKTGLSKNDISFSIVCLRFLQKIKNPKKSRKIAYFALFLNDPDFSRKNGPCHRSSFIMV